MTGRVEQIGDKRALFFAAEGPLLAAPGDTNDFISEVWGQEAGMAVIPVSRLGPDFLKLSTRLAGEVTQKFVNYSIPLVILGDVSAAAAGSGALRDYIRECNEGRWVWFLPDEEALRRKLGAI